MDSDLAEIDELLKSTHNAHDASGGEEVSDDDDGKLDMVFANQVREQSDWVERENDEAPPTGASRKAANTRRPGTRSDARKGSNGLKARPQTS